MVNDETGNVLVNGTKPGGRDERVGKVRCGLAGPGVSGRSMSGRPTVTMSTPVVGATVVFHGLRSAGSRRTSPPAGRVAVGPASVLTTGTATLSTRGVTTTTTTATSPTSTIAIVPRTGGPVGLGTVPGPMVGRAADVARALLTWPGTLPPVHVLGESISCDFGGTIDSSGVCSNVSWWGTTVTSVHGSWPAATIEHDSVPFLDRVADGSEGKVLLNHVRMGIGGRLEVSNLEGFFQSFP